MRTWLKRGVLAGGALGVLGLLLMLVPAQVLADSSTTPEIKVGLGAAILIGLGYYLANSPWLMGVGYFTLYRPLVAGFFVGIILGNPAQGTLIGAAINIAYLGFISAGGSLPGDPALAGWLGTTLALAANLSYGQALALAVPIGLLGTVIWNVRMTVASVLRPLGRRSSREGRHLRNRVDECLAEPALVVRHLLLPMCDRGLQRNPGGSECPE